MKNYHRLVLGYVSTISGIPESRISQRKNYRAVREIIEARQVVAFFLKRYGYKLADIAQIFGYRDHTTVINLLEKIERGMELELSGIPFFFTSVARDSGAFDLYAEGGHGSGAVLSFLAERGIHPDDEYMSDLVDDAIEGVDALSKQIVFRDAV